MEAAAEWERSHRRVNSASAAAASTKENDKKKKDATDDDSGWVNLYTDENPATTIKGLSYQNRIKAERTIRLTRQFGVRYKQYWTIRAMRERAVHHRSYKTSRDMQQAVEVFDNFLTKYVPPTLAEKQILQAEWDNFRRLCRTSANQHQYSKNPTPEELKRARQDIWEGQGCILEGLRVLKRQKMDDGVDGAVTVLSAQNIKCSQAAFTAVFGGPGVHGYGCHEISSSDGSSNVVIQGKDGLSELVPDTKKWPPSIHEVHSVSILYRQGVMLQIRANLGNRSSLTLDSFWCRNKHITKSSSPATACAANGNKVENEELPAPKDGMKNASSLSWSCRVCTFEHCGQTKQLFLACELCCSSRENTVTLTQSSPSTDAVGPCMAFPSPYAETAALSTISPSLSPRTCNKKRSLAWGSLRPPNELDIRGKRRRHKALDAPPPLLDHLVVLDFEWTADDKKKMEPIPEITQFPSVVLALVEKKKGLPMVLPVTRSTNLSLPLDLTQPSAKNVRQDAFAISAFDTFVRPTLNPTLTAFSINLTAITQGQIESAPSIGIALERYVAWLQSLDMVDADGFRKGNWCFVTWGDSDIMNTLRRELTYKSIRLPPCFDKWINLKSDSMFKKHYGREPRGGLKTCVQSVGATWEGRAHNGYVDSINTAKIVRCMVQTGFRFTRSTRGIGKDGLPFGQKR
eukprot:scaffold5_cov169-Amphora_coffeaeformis.AAC.31